MAKFVKGDWVKVQPYPDFYWNYWTDKHTEYCNKVVEVMRVENSKNDANVLFLSLRHFTGGKATWFQDKHCVREESYDRVFAANMQRAVDVLNDHEAVARRCRDDILRHVFTPEEYLTEPSEEIWCDDDYFDEWDDDQCDEQEDDLEEDWEDVITKPIVPLPGLKKKTMIRKGNGSKVIKKALNNAKKRLAKATVDTNDLDPTDWMTDDEMEKYYQSFDDKDTVWGDPD